MGRHPVRGPDAVDGIPHPRNGPQERHSGQSDDPPLVDYRRLVEASCDHRCRYCVPGVFIKVETQGLTHFHLQVAHLDGGRDVLVADHVELLTPMCREAV